MIFLYVKTHNKTGLKYFGKTTHDPMKYRGSGKNWCKHLNEFGNDVSTEVIGSYEDREECARIARQFSDDNNIVKSELWANLIPETLGGWNEDGHKRKETMKKKYGEDYFSRIGGIKNGPNGKFEMPMETKKKISQHPNCSSGGKKNLGKIREKIKCPHCGKEGARNVMMRWHFDNCSSIEA